MKLEKIILPIFLLIASIVFGQKVIVPGAMITDRPDETEAPYLVSKGFMQIETGFFYKKSKDGNVLQKINGYNTTLLRYGLIENLELRLGGDVQEYQEEINELAIRDINSGFTPLLVGAKIGIAEEEGILPQIGLMVHLRLPFTAADAYRPESTAVDFRFAFSHGLSENSDLSYNLGAEWLDDSAEAIYIYTIAYGYDITGNLGFFVEVYGDLPENDTADHFWDGGVTFNLRHNLQLDAYLGSGINAEQELLLGGGFSYRFPN